MNPEEMKKALKEALTEWMDKRFAELGKWSFYSVAVMVFGALVYFILHMEGWRKIP